MKEGRQMLKDFEDFLRARAKIEDEYSRSLQRLVKNAGGTMEIGTLRQSWETLKRETDRSATEHNAAFMSMTEAASRMSDFMEVQRTKRKQKDEAMKKAIRKKQDMFKRMLDAKKAYEGKCREKDQVEKQVTTLQTENPEKMGTRDWEKLFQRQGKSKDEAERAETAYRSTVVSLEHARSQWEKGHLEICDIYQKLEEERVEFLRNEMWVHTNIISQTCIDEDEHNELVRQVLEKCNIQEDIQLVVRERQTGTERPARIDFEPYQQSGFHSHVAKHHGARTLSSGRTPQPLPDHPSSAGRRVPPRRPAESNAVYSVPDSTTL